MRPLRFLSRLAVTLLLLAGASPAHAQIVNGDFESDTGWIPSLPPGFGFAYNSDGLPPNRYGEIQAAGDFAGIGCISQVFQCGEAGLPGDCVIGADAILIDRRPGRPGIIRYGSYPVRLKLFIDGALLATAGTEAWEHIEVRVPCGEHEIRICLEADPGHGGWSLAVDNVTASCEPPVAAEPATWSGVKALYR